MLAALSSHAQAFQFGVKAGVNFSSISTDISNYEPSSTSDFHAGVFAEFKLPKISIQPELLYSRQGAKISSDAPFSKLNYNYLNVPIIVKYYLIDGLNLQVGPQLGFLTTAETYTLISGSDNATDVKETLKSTDLSLAIGVGIDLPLHFNASVRYNWGISDINDDAASDAIRNQVVQISVGYAFIKK